MLYEVITDPEMEPTLENRDKFVQYLIEKELMIQEAMRLELARKKNFIRTRITSYNVCYTKLLRTADFLRAGSTHHR